MTARELRLEDEGIQVTGFEAPRRMDPEIARQQCTCGSTCMGDCQGSCGVACEDDCYNQCGLNGDIMATLSNTPRSVTTYALLTNNKTFEAGIMVA